MNCGEMQELLHACVDGELDVVRQKECEEHLAHCIFCKRDVEALRSLRTALNGQGLYYSPPARLQARIAATLREANREPQARWFPWPFWRGLAAAAALIVIVLLAGSLLRLRSTSSAEETLAQEALAGHLRSLMVNHLADVASTDQHTVKPWFNGKLDFAPPVEDLASDGFPLTGGRLDYLAGRPVAALIYRRNRHILNLFVWPAPPGEAEATQSLSERGYHLLHWNQAGMRFWVVSDLNSREMQQFIALLQSRLAPRPPSGP